MQHWSAACHQTPMPSPPLTFAQAKRHFEEVSGLPVLRPGDDVLIGVVSQKDLNKKPDAKSVGVGRPGGLRWSVAILWARHSCCYLPLHHFRLQDVMSTPPLALKKSDTVEHAAAVMLKVGKWGASDGAAKDGVAYLALRSASTYLLTPHCSIRCTASLLWTTTSLSLAW